MYHALAAVATPDTTYIASLGGGITYIINYILVPVIFALAFIVFLWGVAKAYIFSAGDPAKVKDGHKLILWGLIGFVVMLSIWGLVNLLTSTLGLGGLGAPTYLPKGPTTSL